MHRPDFHKYDRPVVTIHPGELYATDKDEIIQTLLGSCVAVCLIDEEKHISGMNHFMLPGKVVQFDTRTDNSTKYGHLAIERLIQKMINLGADRKKIVAKVFGGGKVLSYENPVHNVSADNIRVARFVLEMEDIPIVEEDVGANYTRKLVLVSDSGKVYLKKSVNSTILEKDDLAGLMS